MPLKPTAIVIPDWRSSWRWMSVHAATLAIVWGTLPTDVQGEILALLWGLPQERVPAVLGVLMLVSRLVNQTASAPPQERRDGAE